MQVVSDGCEPRCAGQEEDMGANPKEDSMLLTNLLCVLDGVCLHVPLPSLFHERINCFEQHKSHCGPVVGLERQPKERCFHMSHPR